MSKPEELVVQVAAKAVIVDDQGKVLVVREAATGENNTKIGYWGLVGGRLEPGEAFFDGLRREVLEETGLEVEPLRPVYVGEWRPTIHGIPHQIVAIFMLCGVKDKAVTVSVEHDAYKWILPAERHSIPMMEPDCFVVDEVGRLD